MKRTRVILIRLVFSEELLMQIQKMSRINTTPCLLLQKHVHFLISLPWTLLHLNAQIEELEPPYIQKKRRSQELQYLGFVGLHIVDGLAPRFKDLRDKVKDYIYKHINWNNVIMIKIWESHYQSSSCCLGKGPA